MMEKSQHSGSSACLLQTVEEGSVALRTAEHRGGVVQPNTEAGFCIQLNMEGGLGNLVWSSLCRGVIFHGKYPGRQGTKSRWTFSACAINISAQTRGKHFSWVKL